MSAKPFEEREKQLIDWCEDQTHWYFARTGQLGKRLRLYRALVLLFSVTVTVLSGIPEVKNLMPWSITVAAGLSTFFAGLLTISKTEESYANYMYAGGQFRRELLLYRQQAGCIKAWTRKGNCSSWRSA